MHLLSSEKNIFFNGDMSQVFETLKKKYYKKTQGKKHKFLYIFSTDR